MNEVKVKFFGEARIKLQVSEDVFSADSLSALLVAVNKKYSALSVKELKDFLIFVNNKSITSLKMFRTKLKDGDVIMLLSPASGG